MEREGRRRRHKRSKKIERMMWGRCQGTAYSVPIVWKRGEGGWINVNSVGLDPEKRVLGCPSAWLMRNRLIIESSTPKLGGVGT